MNVRHFDVTILAALLAVLTLASSASAEGAWVFWERETVAATMKGQFGAVPVPVWHIIESFDSRGM